MQRLVFDLDGTLTIDEPGVPYQDRRPNVEVVQTLLRYKTEGFTIIIQTARNMQSHNGSIGVINARTLPGVIAWLQKHGIPYDELHVGKPWCGQDGFYIDDRAIRPDEFVSLTLPEIHLLIGKVPR